MKRLLMAMVFSAASVLASGCGEEENTPIEDSDLMAEHMPYDRAADEGLARTGPCPTDTTRFYYDWDNDAFGVSSVCANRKPIGYTQTGGDCDNADPRINPDADEICANIRDDDCDGRVDEVGCTTPGVDVDEDGYSVTDDCDDASASVHPGATEVCNAIDDDCDTQIDDGLVTTLWYRDSDADSYGTANDTKSACVAPTGYVANGTDCNDGNSAIKPGATEVCDNVDNDCDSAVDEAGSSTTYYRDADADSYGTANDTQLSCSAPTGYTLTTGDCNDGSASVHPNAAESCNSMDDDCDGSVDEGCSSGTTWYRDADGDGHGTASVTTTSTTQPAGYVGSNNDCDDTQVSVFPGAPETCNSRDDDCDGVSDDGCSGNQTWYRDLDGDTYGSSANGTVTQTSQPSGYVGSNNDCSDSNSSVHPNATEVTNGIDDDCDGSVDEGTSGRTAYTWTFTLDATATSATMDRFEVVNSTTGVITTGSRSGSTVSVSVTSMTGDVLSIQCWLAGNTDWCASNTHSGRITAATGPTGSYSVGKTSGDIKYVTDGSGQRYGGTVK